MMLDWAVSLLVVSLIVFGLIVVSVDFFDNMNHDYVLRDALQSTSQTVSDQVDRLEGIPAYLSQAFYYNSSTTGVAMPGSVANSLYSVEFTHDFVVVVSVDSGPTVGAYTGITQPVLLFPQNMTNQLANGAWPISGYHLHAMDQLYDCAAYSPGTNFQATVESVTVDGAPTYLTFVYATTGTAAELANNYACT